MGRRSARNCKLMHRLLGCLAIAATLPSTSMAGSPPEKLNPPANAKAIWVERDTTQRAFASDQRVDRPVGEPTLERTESGSILKWRAKRTSTSQRTVRTVGGISQSGRSQVRQAAQLAPLDPFQDPFGDSIAQTDEGGSFQIEPPKTQPTPMKLNPLNPLDTAPPAGPTPTPDLPPTAEEGQNGQPMVPEAFGQPRELMRSENLPEPSDKYRGRDCAEDEANCRLIRDKVNTNTINKIELSITPEIEPEAESLKEMEEAKRKRLAEIPSRVWKNRRGEVVADGKIINYRNRRAVIQGDDGKVSQVPFNELGREEICFLTAWWELPSECLLSDDRRGLDAGREDWIAATYTWTASALCHKPLYFEERALERYGHTCGPIVQPLKSGAHFFLNIAFLPYKMGMYPPNECRYALGYYRPGDCAPWMVDPIPFSLRGALFQAGAVVGVAAVIP